MSNNNATSRQTTFPCASDEPSTIIHSVLANILFQAGLSSHPQKFSPCGWNVDALRSLVRFPTEEEFPTLLSGLFHLLESAFDSSR